MTGLFAQYAPLLRAMSDSDLEREIAAPDRFLIESASARGRRIDVAYAPFDYINHAAKIVIVGITPGRVQMRNALMEARRLLKAGKTEAEAMSGAKVFASFSGPMRSNLIAMLDHVGVNHLIGVGSTDKLWAEHSDKVQFTSALRYPTFVNGGNYSGNPSMTKVPMLEAQLARWFGAEMQALRHAIFVPLGDKVADALTMVANKAGIGTERILNGMPHPSGANVERIQFFLNQRESSKLSRQVKPEKILAGRTALTAKLDTLREHQRAAAA